jgi:nucleoside-diphosphate-sugar epimerase
VGRLAPEILRHSELAPGDLLDRESVESAVRGAERVFHCAGQVLDWGPLDLFEATNVRGTRWLLESAVSNRVARFVHLSSIAVFGVPSPAYFDDESPYGQGRDPYSRTKIESEKLVLQAYADCKLPVTILRPAVVYGRHGTWLEEPLRMIQRNKLFLIGGGEGTCHPCFVENLVDAILLCSSSAKSVGQAYIVSDDEPMLFRAYFNHLAGLAGKDAIRRSIPLSLARAMATACETAAMLRRSSRRPLLTHAALDMVCTRSRTSIRKLREELGYSPRFSVESAMESLRGVYQ